MSELSKIQIILFLYASDSATPGIRIVPDGYLADLF